MKVAAVAIKVGFVCEPRHVLNYSNKHFQIAFLMHYWDTRIAIIPEAVAAGPGSSKNDELGQISQMEGSRNFSSNWPTGLFTD